MKNPMSDACRARRKAYEQSPERKAYKIAWAAANPERAAASQEKHRETKNAKYREANKARGAKSRTTLVGATKDQRAACRAAYMVRWYLVNKERVRLQKQVYYPIQLARMNERLATDPTYGLTKRLRCRMTKALYAQGALRTANSKALMGCTPAEFRLHIEAQFLPGMTWDNRSLWHLDHKLPCKHFDLVDPAQQLACFHYTNIRPLWGEDNLRKSAKVLPEFLPT